MKYLSFLLVLFVFACQNPHKSEFQRLRSELKKVRAELAELKAKPKVGLSHHVFFWLKKDLSEADRAAFVEGLRSLTSVETVQDCLIGPVAPTEARDVVDNSYDYALLLHFENMEGQALYQKHPTHLKFIEDHKDKWESVKVYDNLVK